MKRHFKMPNEIIDCGDYCEIILYNKQCKKIAKTLIDKDDLEKVKQYKFHFDGLDYASTRINNKRIRLHQIILPSKKGLETDHINHNGLDNRKCNLRYVTSSQNKMNRKNVLGITWDKSKNKWQAQIQINYKMIFLGRFKNKKDAIKVRRKAEIKYFNEFAYKN